MPNLQVMKDIAEQHRLNLLETSNGTYLIEFEKINGLTPLLASADGGYTWCPEVMGPDGVMWSGRCSIRGMVLSTEIRDMYKTLFLGNPDRMLDVANDLIQKFAGEIIH